MKLTAEAIEGFEKALLWKNFDNAADIPNFHRELWELCCSDAPLVAIAAPREHAKSTAITLVYILAAVLFRAHEYVLLVSDTEGQAILFLGTIKHELMTNTDLIDLFGIKKFEKDAETDIIVVMEDGHRFRITAKGSEQKVRGLKWDHKRPDLIVGDDLENDEIVMNEDRRKKFRNWMIKALLPCRSKKGKVRIVGTILHLDSFLAWVTPLEGQRDTLDDGLKCVSTNKKFSWKSVLYKAHKGSHPSQIQEKSDILWSEKYDKAHFLAKYQEAFDAGLPEGYAQEQLNRPLDESTATFRRSDLKPITDEEKQQIATGRKPLLFYAGGDLAVTLDEQSDYTAFIVVGIDSDGLMYVMDVVRERMDPKQICKTIIELQQRWNLQWMALEQDKTARTIAPFLREQMLKTGHIVNVIPIVAHVDKVARASSIVGRMRIGAVRLDHKADWYPTFENEFLTFPRGKKDDQVDAFSCIGIALKQIATANTSEEEDEEFLRQEERKSDLIYDGRDDGTGY